MKVARRIPEIRVKRDPQTAVRRPKGHQFRLKQGRGLPGTSLQGASMERLPNTEQTSRKIA